MRGTNSGLAVGTVGSPQTSFDQSEYASIAASNEKQLASVMFDQSLIAECRAKDEEITYKNIEFIARDELGETIWLAKGNKFAGLEFILHGNSAHDGYAKDFMEAFGVLESEIVRYLYRVITLGEVVKDEVRPIGSGKTGFARIYYYSARYTVITGIKDNGFIASAYPIAGGARPRKTLTLRLDFLAGPVWKGIWDASSKTDITGISSVDGDEIVASLNREIQALYSSFYSLGFNGKPCRPGKESREKIVTLLKMLIRRLEEINDGAFVINSQLRDCCFIL